MTVRDLQPISVVEDRGFVAIVKNLDPPYQIPSWKKLRRVQLTKCMLTVKPT